MNHAETYACDVLYRPASTKYHGDLRQFQGCPTIAVTPKGRIYLGWYAGGWREPHMDNYNLLIYSDDEGKTWSDPLLVIPSSYEKNIHALDIQLFIDPRGALHVQWVQNNTVPEPENKPTAKEGQPLKFIDGYMFYDFKHSEWEIVCEEPDAKEPIFSEPRYVYQGFLRCKPTFLENGDWLCFAYDQLTDRYGYSISKDAGKTFSHHYGSKKFATYFDEAMAYQLRDGRLRMFARTRLGELAESYSCDNGLTWSETALSGIVCADTRFYVKKLPSGRVLLITNDDRTTRKNITLLLSEDDGVTWKYKKCIDTRELLSYPDADVFGDRIYLSYDRGRTTHREILFASFTEQDIIDDTEIEIRLVSKPKDAPSKAEVTEAIEKQKLIAIVRGVKKEALPRLADALYAGGIRLMEITYSANGNVSDAETAEAIASLVSHVGDRMLIGAGTVITPEQVRLTKLAGGSFIISPDTDEAVIRESQRCALVSIPGALTPSEIKKAIGYGADFVKLFPITSLGVEYVKAVKAPLSQVRLLAVGGIDESNLKDYLKAGICGVGLGSKLIDLKLIEKGDWSAIEARAKRCVKELENG